MAECHVPVQFGREIAACAFSTGLLLLPYALIHRLWGD